MFQDYGINVLLRWGISLRQESAWFLDLLEEKGPRGLHNMELYFGEDDLKMRD
ncbi:hypothetical protein [Hungatella hathewayi]|uniref:hypothetical protein n=1 Tax=Hungatella hathewayi TaxID=154046 RepID=UPI0035669855